MIPLLFGSRRDYLILRIPRAGVRVSPTSGEWDVLLGSIVLQAMHDGMLGIRVGLDLTFKEAFLKYFGPSHYEPDRRTWWDMYAPPPECYPRLLQVCFSLADLRTGFPVSGMLPAIRGGKRFSLLFETSELASFQIMWGEGDILSSSSPRPSIETPGWEPPDRSHPMAEGADTHREDAK
jgi:hypothetical protein